MQEATMARKPSTTMTAMAQCGNPESDEADWTSPPWEEEEEDVSKVRVDDMDAEEAEAAEADDAEAAEEEEAAMTESAYVVSVNVLWVSTRGG